MLEPFGPKADRASLLSRELAFRRLMSDSSVPHFASDTREAGTAEEDKAAVIGNLALFGTYTVDGEGTFMRMWYKAARSRIESAINEQPSS